MATQSQILSKVGDSVSKPQTSLRARDLRTTSILYLL